MNYIEVTISLDNIDEIQKDLLMNELAGVGFESFVEQDNFLLAYVNQDEFNENSLVLISKDYGDFKFTKKNIEQQNWNAKWESQFTPIIIDEFCIIRAPFHEPKPNFKFDIIIEPKMSFGTGHHATTRLMINQLRTIDVENKTVLDMGCGTGILAIVASKLNANKVDAIDIDQWASENTVENAQRNNIGNIYTKTGIAKDIINNYNWKICNFGKNLFSLKRRKIKLNRQSFERNPKIT